MRVVLVEVVEVDEQKAVVPRVHLHWAAKAGPRLSQSPPTITVDVGVEDVTTPVSEAVVEES